MKSPFPGMDPYLEQYWGDVHSSLMVYMRDQISEQLPGDLQARVEESLMVDADDYTRIVYPDVQVVETSDEYVAVETTPANVAVAEPCVIALPEERRTQRHLEIVDRNSGNRVVTAIELLSPANKCSDAGRHRYRLKQLEYVRGQVNLVEIDLIRAGSFVVAVPLDLIPRDRRTPYVICIRRAMRPNDAEVVPIPLAAPLPNFRLPLRPEDSDIVVQLQPLLDECYRRGRYGSLEYNRPLDPPLSESDESWIEKVLSEYREKRRAGS